MARKYPWAHTGAVDIVEFRLDRESLGGRGPFRVINLFVNGTRLQDLVRSVERPMRRPKAMRASPATTPAWPSVQRCLRPTISVNLRGSSLYGTPDLVAAWTFTSSQMRELRVQRNGRAEWPDHFCPRPRMSTTPSWVLAWAEDPSNVLGAKPSSLVTMRPVLDPRHEHMRVGPSIGSGRPVLLAVRPDEASDHGDVAHRTIRNPAGHLPVERTFH